MIRTFAILFSIVYLFSGSVQAQDELLLLGEWTDESLTVTDRFDSRYNECWGLFVNNTEIGIIASTEGTHFIDLSDPYNLTEIKSAYIPGAAQGPRVVHRDYHDLNGFLYAVADDPGQHTLQIIDIRGLPDTAFTVYDSNEILRRAHNIFIDNTTARLYACSSIVPENNSFERYPLSVLDISDPLNPVLLSHFSQIGGVLLPDIHDIYVRNDTAYLNGSNDGFFVADFSDIMNVQLLGTMTDYPDEGYNHSGWLSDDGRHYYMADETHGKDLKVVDVSDLTDISVIHLFDAESSADSTSIPHNLIVHCGNLYVSYYYDGLQVYDLSDPEMPERKYFFDTYPDKDTAFYAGNWGVYPFLPSGNIIASDMQRGLMLFAPIEEECESTTSVEQQSELPETDGSFVYPNPVQVGDEAIFIEGEVPDEIYLISASGQEITLNIDSTSNRIDLPVNLYPGIYFLRLKTKNHIGTVKLVVHR